MAFTSVRSINFSGNKPCLSRTSGKSMDAASEDTKKKTYISIISGQRVWLWVFIQNFWRKSTEQWATWWHRIWQPHHAECLSQRLPWAFVSFYCDATSSLGKQMLQGVRFTHARARAHTHMHTEVWNVKHACRYEMLHTGVNCTHS